MLAEHSKKSSEFQGFKFISTSEIPELLLEQRLLRIKRHGLWEVAMAQTYAYAYTYVRITLPCAPQPPVCNKQFWLAPNPNLCWSDWNRGTASNDTVGAIWGYIYTLHHVHTHTGNVIFPLSELGGEQCLQPRRPFVGIPSASRGAQTRDELRHKCKGVLSEHPLPSVDSLIRVQVWCVMASSRRIL